MRTLPNRERKFPTSVSFDQYLLEEMDRIIEDYDDNPINARSRFIRRACEELVNRFLDAEKEQIAKTVKKRAASSPVPKKDRDATPSRRTVKAAKKKPTPKVIKTPKIINSSAKVTHSVAPAKSHVKRS